MGFWNNLLVMINDWIGQYNATTTTTTKINTSTTTTTTTSGSTSAFKDAVSVAGSICAYKGSIEKSLDKIPITTNIIDPNINGNYVYFSYGKMDWSIVTGKKSIQGDIGILWEQGGKLIGGRFDHRAVNQKMKGLENIYGSILRPNGQPPNGATVYFYLINDEQTERSNIVESKTKWRSARFMDRVMMGVSRVFNSDYRLA